MVCCNNDWERQHGGMVRVWPPPRGGPVHVGSGPGMHVSQRSLTGSDAGLSQQSEERSLEDTLSLRSHNVGPGGGGGGGSVTSSMWAELGAQEHETASVDTLSIADPSDQREEWTGLEWQDVDGTMVLDIAPLAGRLILFLSGAVDHAIAPCTVDMVAATAWFQ